MGQKVFQPKVKYELKAITQKLLFARAGQGQENRNGERVVSQVENGHQDFIRKQENLLWQAEEDTEFYLVIPTQFS